MDLNDITRASASLDAPAPARLRQTTAPFVHTPGQVVYPDQIWSPRSSEITGRPWRTGDPGVSPQGPAATRARWPTTVPRARLLTESQRSGPRSARPCAGASSIASGFRGLLACSLGLAAGPDPGDLCGSRKHADVRPCRPTDGTPSALSRGQSKRRWPLRRGLRSARCLASALASAWPGTPGARPWPPRRPGWRSAGNGHVVQSVALWPRPRLRSTSRAGTACGPAHQCNRSPFGGWAPYPCQSPAGHGASEQVSLAAEVDNPLR